jgi:hypothetical protein
MGRVEGPGGAIGDTLTADLAVVDLHALDTHLAGQVRL